MKLYCVIVSSACTPVYDTNITLLRSIDMNVSLI